MNCRACMLGIAFLLSACSTRLPEVDATDAALQRNGAQLLHAGVPFSGIVVSRESGQIIARQPYQNGLLEGVVLEWHRNGRLSSERTYQAGNKIGRHRGWWPNGLQRFDYEFAEGEFHGEVRSWFESGQLAEQRQYAHGYESGPQRTWYGNGQVRANYYFKDGRRYGTIGTKLCISENPVHKAAESST